MSFKVVQVGLGQFGRRWVDVLLDSPDWEHAALVTRNREVLQESGAKCNLGTERLFTDIETALKTVDDADAVLISTPYFRHADEILLSLEYDKHVLVEKPLFDDLEVAYKLQSAATARDRTVMVNEDYRFLQGSTLMREFIVDGAIGAPEFISIHYFRHHSFPEDDWRHNLRYPVLLENATHHYDLLRFITGKEAVRITCAATRSARTSNWARPTASVQIEMEDGLLVDFCASWAYPFANTRLTGVWWIWGTEGGILWDAAKPEAITLSRQGRERCFSVLEPARPALGAVLEEFTAALKNGRRPAVDIEDNVKTIEMMVASIESAEHGTPVSIQELRSRYHRTSLG